jgi:hypothetical protein
MKPNMFWFKSGLSKIEKIEIKYGCEGFEPRNNFPYLDFSIFRMDFKLKFRESSMRWIQLKFV